MGPRFRRHLSGQINCHSDVTNITRSTITAGRRRLDDDRLTRLQHGGVAASKFFDAAIVAPHPILADLTVPASRKPEGRHASMPGQDRAFNFLQKTDGAPDSVAG